jgi:hypothetical protein
MARTRNPNLESAAHVEKSWRGKLSPLFLEMAHGWKQLCTEGEWGRGSVQRELMPGQLAMLKKSMRRASRVGRKLPEVVFTHLCWVRWRKLPQELFRAIAERYDPKAYDKLAQVSRSFYRWSHGKLNYEQDLKVRGDERHIYLMFAGALEGGIDRLTERELVDFFDKMCPCGKETHSESALMKLRGRTRRSLDRSVRAASGKIRPVTPGQPKLVRWRKRTCLVCAKPYHRKADRIA